MMLPEWMEQAIDPDRLPRTNATGPRVAGRIKVLPEDFAVDEVPAYPFEGDGPHVYLRDEKCDLAGPELLRRMSRALGVPEGELGMAGTKDRRAVTRQWISVPESCAGRLDELTGVEGIRVLETTRHRHKLRTGHLRGNRFDILVREADPAAAESLHEVAAIVSARGFPNLFGVQRFGREGASLRTALGCLEAPQRFRRLRPFERRMVASSLQSTLFNAWVAERIGRGLDRTVLAGDLMSKADSGGIFYAVDVPIEQARLDAGETRISGPMFGKSMMAARDEAGAFEQSILDRAGLVPESFQAFASLAEGTRRPLFVRPEELSVEPDPDGVRIRVFLPKGTYATVLLREFMTSPPAPGAESHDVDL